MRARACVCAHYFCDRSPPCSWAVVAPTSSCPCIRERLYQKKRWVRSNARNDNEHEHEHARTHACKHAHAYTRIHVHTTDWHFYQASSSATSSASSSAGGRCDHGSSWKRGSSAGPKGLSGSREAATMNHSQTIVSCTMTCALAREHGSEHGSERGTNSPDGRSSGHAHKLPMRIEPVDGNRFRPAGRCSSTEFRVLSVVRRILGTTLQVI